MVAPYCPDYGDVVWINFEPQTGREITKYRPALVLSPRTYNQRSRLCVVCPITSKLKGSLFEVAITLDDRTSVVKSDQIRSFDWHDRRAKFIKKAPRQVVKTVTLRLAELLRIPMDTRD